MASSAELGAGEGSVAKLRQPPKWDAMVLVTMMAVTVQWRRLWGGGATIVATMMVLCTPTNKIFYAILEIEHGLSTVTSRRSYPCQQCSKWCSVPCLPRPPTAARQLYGRLGGSLTSPLCLRLAGTQGNGKDSLENREAKEIEGSGEAVRSGMATGTKRHSDVPGPR